MRKSKAHLKLKLVGDVKDKKDFFNEQCLIIEENNKRGKTIDFLQKIGNIKEAFYPKMGTIKDKNGRDL